MQRPQWKAKRTSAGQSYLTRPFLHRIEPIRLYYRINVDDLELDDRDDYYRVDIPLQVDPAWSRYVSPTEKQRVKYRHQALLRAQAIVRELATYRQNAAWRKRLRSVEHEFDFVFEPYRKALIKKYTAAWRFVVPEKLAKEELEAHRKEIAANRAATQAAQAATQAATQAIESLQRHEAGATTQAATQAVASLERHEEWLKVLERGRREKRRHDTLELRRRAVKELRKLWISTTPMRKTQIARVLLTWDAYYASLDKPGSST